MPNHHPDNTALVEYATGALAEPEALVVATHLALCRLCHQATLGLEAVGGQLLDSAEPTDVSKELLARTLSALGNAPADQPGPSRGATARYDTARPVHEDIVLPGPLSRYVRHRSLDIPWRQLSGSLSTFDLLEDHAGASTRLLRIAAGHAQPRHTHVGSESTLVLAGAFEDEFGYYQRGDVAVLDERHEHHPIADSCGDCICLAVNRGSVTLTGPVGRLLNPFLSF